VTTKELSYGIHNFSLENFIKDYCSPTETSVNERWHFASSLIQIHRWAESAHASYLLIGGSFVSSNPNPADLDIVVVFKNNLLTQKCPESLLIGQTRVDIQYISEDNPLLLDAFIFLLAHSKSGVAKGIACIPVNSNNEAPIIPSQKPELYNTVIEIYSGQTTILPYSRKGIIIPIHGVNTNAYWLSYFSLLASNSGWGIAPFVYGRECPTTLLKSKRREKITEDFRIWLIKVREQFNGPIAIFGHSLGTYIFAKYVELYNDNSDKFCGVVLAGSILNTGFDWNKYLDSNRITALYNTYSIRDEWVKKMPNGGYLFCKDTLYGHAGYSGFEINHNRLFQNKLDILNHVNMFENDTIKQWINFLEISFKLYNSTDHIRQNINLENIIRPFTY
jgi:hypothetical protein